MARGALESTAASAQSTRRRFVPERMLSPLILAPSIIAIFIFVYAFIGLTFWVSISNWTTPKRDLSLIQPLWETYHRLFTTTRFQIDIRNTIVFT
ncbi:MAG: hypothetical protein WBA46_18445, partial [Thermomicrobiales bacterium]